MVDDGDEIGSVLAADRADLVGRMELSRTTKSCACPWANGPVVSNGPTVALVVCRSVHSML